MSKLSSYTQCKLEKTKDGSTVVLVSWIPSKFAKLNNKLLLLDTKDYDYWTVSSIGTTQDYLPDSHKDSKQHKKNTGDSK